ncbi:involucrin [Onthophagus taurus]|uniref:involucrin n=1 Tax=Onthophagus taurus TaxID=166361 RepID=UPI0039BE7E47
MEPEPKLPPREGLPKIGKVHEMRREWLVREDGALAYQLQSQEFNQHLQHNKHKNAQVREDFPCALDEQLREQRLAEQAAAVYHKMLQEQEEVDNQIARDLAEKLEKEERMKRRQLEKKDENVAKLLSKDSPKRHPPPPKLPEKSPHRPDKTNYFANLPSNIPRKALQMPLPNEMRLQIREEYMTPEDCIELYTEPYDNHNKNTIPNQQAIISNHFERLDLQEIGVPIDEITERKIQEERDAELARQLQEQEGAAEEILLNRDRMLAIEARDKELAKMLQERERAKVKRARERAKQKAHAKKQMEEHQQKLDTNQLLPDDSYAFPADLIPHRGQPPVFMPQKSVLEEDSYSNPLDVLHQEVRYSPQKSFDGRIQNGVKNLKYNDKVLGDEVPPPCRPTQLDLRSPLNRISKPRMPDPEPCSDNTSAQTIPSQQLVNIAMAIDPTYPRNKGYQSSPSYDTTSSTITTTSSSTTSSSSPGVALPPPDISELVEGNSSPVPPYMPIQGQRRTSSLEKKQKKKNKDGCRQQ